MEIPKDLQKYDGNGVPEIQSPAATAFRLQGTPNTDALRPLFNNTAAQVLWRIKFGKLGFNEQLRELQRLGFHLDE